MRISILHNSVGVQSVCVCVCASTIYRQKIVKFIHDDIDELLAWLSVDRRLTWYMNHFSSPNEHQQSRTCSVGDSIFERTGCSGMPGTLHSTFKTYSFALLHEIICFHIYFLQVCKFQLYHQNHKLSLESRFSFNLTLHFEKSNNRDICSGVKFVRSACVYTTYNTKELLEMYCRD